MDYRTLRFFWTTADLALKAGTELDRSRRDRSAAVEAAVESLLESLQRAVNLSEDNAGATEFQAAFELYRHIIAPGADEKVKTTADLANAISSFADGWTVQLSQRNDGALHDMMRICLDIHQFCLSRSMMSGQDEPGFAA